jgi:hypothetical protein
MFRTVFTLVYICIGQYMPGNKITYAGNACQTGINQREVREGWRKDYNEVRPHGSLNDRTPMEYANTAGF